MESKFRYNGKEQENKEFADGNGLETYDYGARHYEPQIGKFNTIDPHADNYHSWTPYNYVGDNPMNIIDPNGMDWASDKDKSTADELTNQLKMRKSELDKAAAGISNVINKLKETISAGGLTEKSLKKLNDKLAGAESDLSDIQNTITDISSSINELKEMGETQKMTFAFNDLGADKGKGFLSTKVDKDKEGKERTVTLINFTYSSSDVSGKDMIANQIHEATHGYQFFKGIFTQDAKNKNTDLFTYSNNDLKWATELDAYQRQYAIYGPYPKDSPIYVPNRSGITFDFIKSIKINGTLVYPPIK